MASDERAEKDVAREQWIERTFTVRLDVGTYGSEPDDDEIAYLLRMGGIDAEAITDKYRCASCGTTWDEDDLQQVQPDGRNACPFEGCGVDTLEPLAEYEARQASEERERINRAAQGNLLDDYDETIDPLLDRGSL